MDTHSGRDLANDISEAVGSDILGKVVVVLMIVALCSLFVTGYWCYYRRMVMRQILQNDIEAAALEAMDSANDSHNALTLDQIERFAPLEKYSRPKSQHYPVDSEDWSPSRQKEGVRGDANVQGGLPPSFGHSEEDGRDPEAQRNKSATHCHTETMCSICLGLYQNTQQEKGEGEEWGSNEGILRTLKNIVSSSIIETKKMNGGNLKNQNITVRSLATNSPDSVQTKGGLAEISPDSSVQRNKEDREHHEIMVRRLPCSHYFHPACIEEWLLRQANCPLCKQEVHSDEIAGESGAGGHGEADQLAETEETRPSTQ